MDLQALFKHLLSSFSCPPGQFGLRCRSNSVRSALTQIAFKTGDLLYSLLERMGTKVSSREDPFDPVLVSLEMCPLKVSIDYG